ncbi:hypothetical protein FGF1_17500 [Flavobacteriaceae bacterium GF1]
MVPAYGDYYFCFMQWFLPKDYKILLLSGLITAGLTLLLVQLGYVILDSGGMGKPFFVLINVLGLSITLYIFYFLLTRYPMYQVLGVIGLLAIAALAEHFLHISENPITVPFIILFWLGVAYLILPQFFRKYWMGILLVYGMIIAYYFFSFISATDYGGDDRASFVKYMLLPIPVFVVLWIYEQWRWVRNLKADRTKAELTLLKSQVNPHFFFNTLNNLYGLIMEKSPQAPDVVLKLSDMMRYTIDMGKEDKVSIRDEVSFLENYIALHKIRYQKNVDIQFDHDVDTDIQVAPLLFINLLENAFKHGVEPLTENAYVHLSLRTIQNRVVFKIANNYETDASNTKNGTGLDNLKKRLEHAYPNRYELSMDKTETMYSVHLSLLLNITAAG